MTGDSGPAPTLQVGALEGRRWAGLVLADARGGAGLGIRLRFTNPAGRSWDWEDWYWAVSAVGPHAPGGAYARVTFDLTEAPTPENEPRSADLVLEWSRGRGYVVLKAHLQAAGTLEVLGDTPWDWADRWAPDDHRAHWQGRIREIPVWVVFGEGGEAGRPKEAVPCRSLVVGPEGDEARSITLAAVWGQESSAVRAREVLQDVPALLSAARAAWFERRPSATGEWPDLVDRISDQIHWMVLLQPETGALYTPAGRRWIFPRSEPLTPDLLQEPRPDHWTIFGWDSFFNALELSVTSPELAWGTLLAGLGTQYDNGNVPNWRGRFGGTPDRSQPPVAAFAALRLHLTHPAESRLDEALPSLLRWSDWWDGEHRGRPRRRGLSEGLYAWGSDSSLVPAAVPPWEANASGHQRAAWESGQDDLPLWDDVEWDDGREALATSAVDLCSYRALDLECLARIADLTGDSGAAERARQRRDGLMARMNDRLWSEEEGLFLDELRGGHSSRVAASNFLPLLAGVPDEQRAERMVSALEDPERFWGPWLLPSVSRDDPAFPEQQYWRGSIWPPIHYLVLQGLRRYGFYDVARILALRGARMFLEDSRATGMCRENFDARTGRGHGRRFQSWGPLFALGAVEELVRSCPWGGITVGWAGSDEPGSGTGVAGLHVGGHTWWVEPEPGGYRFRMDEHDWVRVESSGPLTHLDSNGPFLAARCSRDARLTSRHGHAHGGAGDTVRIPMSTHDG